ncbi:MAG: hypothetical protein Q8N22_02615 [bacterium]|nr:hypothetical protein [bacterium]
MLKFIIFFSVFILLATGAIYFVFHSHFLKVAAVDIVGSLRAEEIKEVLIDNLLKTSKIRSWLGPENLLFWPSKISNIPASLYWLSGLSLEKNWQEKIITLNAKEREPWLLWCLTDSGNCYWLDEQGIVFSSAPEAEGFLVSKVSEQGDRRQLSLGQLFYDNSQFAENTLEIIKQIKNSSLAVSRFSIENPNLEELTVETTGPKLYFSLRFLPQNFDKVLNDLINRPNFRKLEYIDFRVENRIYYK